MIRKDITKNKRPTPSRKGTCKSNGKGICGSINKADDYCLFHKPNKDKKEASIFYQKILERASRKRKPLHFEEALNFDGYIFPPVPEEYSNGQSTFFVSSRFSKPVYFDEVTFEGNINFKGAEFKKGVSFRRATFLKEAGFHNTSFYPVDVEDTEVNIKTDSNELIVDTGLVSFIGTTFRAPANFVTAHFYTSVAFDSVQFDDTATFRRV